MLLAVRWTASEGVETLTAQVVERGTARTRMSRRAHQDVQVHRARECAMPGVLARQIARTGTLCAVNGATERSPSRFRTTNNCRRRTSWRRIPGNTRPTRDKHVRPSITCTFYPANVPGPLMPHQTRKEVTRRGSAMHDPRFPCMAGFHRLREAARACGVVGSGSGRRGTGEDWTIDVVVVPNNKNLSSSFSS
jgi:hypothetical protein